MRRAYLEPATKVVTIKPRRILSASEGRAESIGPGQANTPAASRYFNGWEGDE